MVKASNRYSKNRFYYIPLIVFSLLIAASCSEKTVYEEHVDNKSVISANIPMGYYPKETMLRLVHSREGGHIYYTTNGQDPDTTSKVFNAALPLADFASDNRFPLQLLAENSEVRSMVFEGNYALNYLPNAVSVKAAVFDSLGNRLSDFHIFDFLLANHENLPVCMINISPQALLDRDSGLFVAGAHYDADDPLWTGNYYQRGKDWERKAHITYFTSTDTVLFQQNIGFRAHGGNSRRFDQKGMRIIARKGLDEKRIKEQLFTHGSDIKRFTLKPFKASWSGYGFENLLGYRLARHLDVDCLEIYPVVVYINGVYWGIYLLEERMDKHYFKRLSGNEDVRFDWARSDRILKSADSLEKSKDFDHFKSTLQEINDENYAELEKLIDINSYIDYQILEQFIGNFDWPANNNKRWREADGKWRWIYFDGDAAFGNPYFNTLHHATGVYNERFYSADENTTVLFRKLCAYPPFYDRFEKRLNELLETTLSSEFVQQEMDSILVSEKEITRQIHRFAYPESIEDWHKIVNEIEHFIVVRPEAMRGFYAEIEATLSGLQDQQ